MTTAKTQTSLPFFDSAEAATRHAIESSQYPLKQVAAALWPDKSPDTARTALANALNETRAERLTAEQHIFVANFCKRYDWLYYAAHRCSHTQPSPVTPDEIREQMQARFLEKAEQMEVLLREMRTMRETLGLDAA